MISKFQYRFLGMSILVILAIIFLPWLLDGKKEHDITSVSNSVLSSPLGMNPFVSLDSPALVQSTKVLSFEIKEKKISKEDAVDYKDQNKSPPSEKEWRSKQAISEIQKEYVIQLGAFNDIARVNQIIAKLRLSDYQVFTFPPVPIKGKITRILIGPHPSKDKLESMQPELYRLVGLNGQIKTY
ncbi:SPOR domain-containing protein [Candidatus Williamhamiltonella defendens]|uniref:SPOR domain-containing protein n=1 Tax=Candidatus Williamhamiltonella defendens TaxID=138072 RepID=UPI00130E005E|nr:SPOR domain-containing protein [Candidatus Hamiltonella defensa]